MTTWPSSTASVDNLDQGTDNPRLARADLKDALDKLNLIIGSPAPYETRTDLAVANVPSDVDVVKTYGYATFGDGGGAVYKRVGSEPAHVFKVQSADLTWWEGVTATSGIVNVRQLGATGTTDDTTAFQNAIDLLISTVTTQPMSQSRVLFVPNGTYIVSSPLVVKSGVEIVGEGPRSRIKEVGSGWSGSELVQMKYGGSGPHCYKAKLRKLGFEATTTTVAAIRVDDTLDDETRLIDCEFEDLVFDTTLGLICETYGQNCRVRRIHTASGAIDTILSWRGNANIFDQVNKETSTGTTAGAYVKFSSFTVPVSGNSTGNYLRNMVIEGTGNAGKYALDLTGCRGFVIEGLWDELTTSNGYAAKLTNCDNIEFKGYFRGIRTGNKLSLTNSQAVSIESLYIDLADEAVADTLEVDSTSELNIESLYDRRGKGGHGITNNITIGHNTMRTLVTTPATGVSPFAQHTPLVAHNILANGSFEAGAYKWALNGGTVTEDFVQSEVAPGLMAKLSSWSGSLRYRQQFTVPTEWVGQQITVTALIKVEDSGSNSPFVTPAISDGSGITLNTAGQIVGANGGWAHVTMTFIPQSTGSPFVSFQCSNPTANTIVYLDEVVASLGPRALAGQGHVGMLTLNGNSQTYLSAAPATGTWQQGDIVWNTGATAGGTAGWICTTAGSPGTWKTFGSIAA